MALIAIKFLILPWLEYLESQKQELQTLTKKLTRSEALLIVKEQVVANEQAIRQMSKDLLQGVAVTKDAASYRVEFQQQLQSTVESYGVQLVLFEWLSDEDLSTFSVTRARLSIRLKGSVGDVARANVAIERQMPHVQIKDLKATWQGELQASHQVELAALIDVDYIVEPQ